MREDKAYVLRRTFVAITLILVFATAGLLIISMQLKTVTLNYYGQITTIKTLSTTVQSFLTQNKVYISENTQVEPSLDEKISKNLEIKVYSKVDLAKLNTEDIIKNNVPVIAKIEEVVEKVPFKEEQKDNPTIERGKTNTIQEGVEGQLTTKFIVKTDKTGEVYREKLAEEVTAPSINKVIEVGTKLNPIASRSATVATIKSSSTPQGFRKYNIKLPVEQQEFAYNACQKYGIPYELFLAIMFKESGFNPNSIGGGNSYGLCQVHISNHSNLRAKLGVTDFLNPYDNITAGAYMLSHYFNVARKRVSGEATIEVYALNAYNMGEGAYYNLCYSKGILDRAYSTSVIATKNKLIANGGL